MAPRATGKGRGGRPTAAEAVRRQAHLLQVAGAMFMAQGFHATSMDAVAEAAGMSKRTLYARYADKNALFSAVLRDLIERWLRPIHQFQSSAGDLESTLVEIGRHLLESALAPGALNVRRIIIAESRRQPEFARLAYEEGWRHGVSAIAAVLKRHEADLRLDDLEGAAAQFMSLAVDRSLRRATLGIDAGIAAGEADIDRLVRAAVDLFLNGARRPDRAARPPEANRGRETATRRFAGTGRRGRRRLPR